MLGYSWYRLTPQGEAVAEGAARRVYLYKGTPNDEEDSLRVVFLDYSQKLSGPYPPIKETTVVRRLKEGGWEADPEVVSLMDSWKARG